MDDRAVPDHLYLLDAQGDVQPHSAGTDYSGASRCPIIIKVDMNKITVTQPYLPPLDEFIPYLEEIWENKVLTNNGPYHRLLEDALCDYLGVKYISLFTNGTIALITALKALDVTGEVITTPYTFVATAHSLKWNGITPVFIDTADGSFNMDAFQIENAITSKTSAIMPVHCYGAPCNVELIDKVAKKHGLKVIYDAAHAFGVSIGNRNILEFGDMSILSFHATKVFNTFEGGAIVCRSKNDKLKIDNLKNFGFLNEITITDIGINGKMSEVNAAFGLLQLKYIDNVLYRRNQIAKLYINCLQCNPYVEIPLRHMVDVVNNSYFPIIVLDEYPLSRDELYEYLKGKDIYTRRYFYPLISDFSIYYDELITSHKLPNSRFLSDKVLCLPIYPDLSDESVMVICNLINDMYKHASGSLSCD